MSTAPISRLIPRRPLYRCLNAPRTSVPRSHLRPIPSTRHASTRGRPNFEDINIKELETAPRNPLDAVEIHRREAARQAYYIRRRNFAAVGLVVSMIIPLIIISVYELPPPKQDSKDSTAQATTPPVSTSLIKPERTDARDSANREFQGKPVVIQLGDKLVTQDPSSNAENVEVVSTGTSYVPYFPRTIHLPTSTSPENIESTAEYTLLGLGIRTVSFLSVQVYVVGLYVKTTSLASLQSSLIKHINPSASAPTPEEKEALRSALLDPDRSNEIWTRVLQQKGPDGVEMALRVVPVRGTDFKHLRDGWVRGITTRTDEADRRRQQRMGREARGEERRIGLPQPVDPSEFADETFGLAMREFKNLFSGRGKAPKGSVLTLTRNSEGVFGVLYQPKGKEGEGQFVHMGEVRDERVSRLVWLLYLGGKNVSSEPARRNVVEGCLGIVERPVGTVEGRVE